MAYTNPGRLFIEAFGPVKEREDIYRYVDFLRREAGLSIDPPVNLHRIYKRFEMTPPDRFPLTATNGMVVDHELGIIVINDNDPALRQRFSEAHELIELLFAELPEGLWDSRSRGGFRHSTKEQLCNEGAAELLMPEASFRPYVEAWGCSFDTAQKLGEMYQVSTTAALVQLARVTGEECAVVLFRYKNKPSEIQSKVAKEQSALFPGIENVLPPKKLRVEWSLGGPFIPPDKSVPEGSLIQDAWHTGEFTYGVNQLDLGPAMRGRLFCENRPFLRDDEIWVLSLVSKAN